MLFRSFGPHAKFLDHLRCANMPLFHGVEHAHRTIDDELHEIFVGGENNGFQTLRMRRFGIEITMTDT